jgi:caffeoyl-CoA O-methyltransferase
MHFISEELEQYAHNHTSAGSALLDELERATWQKMINPRMLSGHLQGRFLALISQMLSPRLVVEIGTYTGYSALCLLEGLAEDGILITMDINDELDSMHQKYLLRHERSSAVKRWFGDARELIANLPDAIDLVFIDADKTNYLHYYEALIPKVRRGGVVLIDNVLWSGKVIEPLKAGDEDTRVLVALNERVQQDPRVENVLLPLRDGLMMVRKV